MRKLISTIGIILVSGCAGISDSEKATYRAVNKWAAEYVINDKELSNELRRARLNTLRSWRFKLEESPESWEDYFAKSTDK